MSIRSNRLSSRILDASSDPLRLKILKLLYTHGTLSYSNIMNSIKLHPNRDAGKFAYHLRRLRQAGLVKVDKKNKKYVLTLLGGDVVEFSKSLEERLLRKREKLLVRTSRLTLEEFDRNKIAKSLIKEANIPAALAQKIVSEVEERLLKLGSLYLTAPLIREFVNAVLIEKGLKEYRDKLTRLGLPVYDVSHLIQTAGKNGLNVETIRNSTSNSIIREYVLINTLPQDIAIAHLSGFIHIENLGSWILKPCEFQHDLRFFLKHGFKLDQRRPFSLFLNPPKTFNAALSIINVIMSATAKELTGEQMISYFNTFLAPYVSDLSFDEIKEAIRMFIFNLNQITGYGIYPAEVALSVDATIPSHLEKITASVKGKKIGNYGDFLDEAHTVLKALLEVMFENDYNMPVFHPFLIFNLRPEDFRKNNESLLIKVHELAAKYGTPFFSNLFCEGQMSSTYFTSGTKLSSDWNVDWNLDTLRTGSLDKVLVNLPRLAYEADRNDDKFFELFEKYVSMALRTLEMKYKIIEERMNQFLLPVLSHSVLKDAYFRVASSLQVVGLIGLYEAVKFHRGLELYGSQEALKFAKEIVEYARKIINAYSKNTNQRAVLAQIPSDEASQRFAELDKDRYGWASIYAQGTKTAPYYTDLVVVPLETQMPLKERLQIEGDFHTLFTGGHLTVIELHERKQEAEKLFNMSKEICQSTTVGAFTYSRQLSYCNNCKKVFTTHLVKCPKCESVETMTTYGRLSVRYLPLNLLPSSKRKRLKKRIRYFL